MQLGSLGKADTAKAQFKDVIEHGLQIMQRCCDKHSSVANMAVVLKHVYTIYDYQLLRSSLMVKVIRPGGCEVVMSLGTRQYQLEITHSSHLVLFMNLFSTPINSSSPTLQFANQHIIDSATTSPPKSL